MSRGRDRAPSQHAYRGAVGATRPRAVHVTLPSGDVVSAKVHDEVDAVADPELAHRLFGGTLNRLTTADGGELAITTPVVFHDPASEVFALVASEADRHREFELRAALWTEMAGDRAAAVPAYVREFAVVFGPAGLTALLERKADTALGTGAAVRALRERSGSVHITLAPPRIRKPGEEKIDRYLLGLGPDALLVRSMGALRHAASGGPPRVGDASLNVTNRLTAATVLGAGLAAFTPGFDLDAAQVTALVEGPFGPWAELVVHHPMALFHMEHCVIARELSSGSTHKDCGRPCERHQVSLRDRAGMDHPVEADVGCRNTVFHAAPQSAAGIVPAAQAGGVGRFRVELVRESPEEVGRVVEAYRALLSGSATPEAVWRTLRAEGHYGVVRGSLRVLTA